MAGRIRQEDLEAVRERTDIVKVVAGQLQLKKAGRDSLVGICPFHPEKTPSFSVSPSKQVYYCFGCGEGGDVFHFMEKTENLSFVEAVEKLARDAGVTLRYEGQTSGDRRAAGRRQALHRAVAEAARLYAGTLVNGGEGADARRYLAERGITKESIERFGIGYAPGYPDFLLRRLARSFSTETLVDAGLVTKDGTGTLRDRFRGRVTFPIHDLSGNPVGFGGRLLAGPATPPDAAKYVNSRETDIYHKGRLLYNLNRAKADITRTGQAVLVEGYTDVIALDQAGVHQTVATCGTALGEEHLRTLARFTERVVLAFDSDAAGARAAERAFAFHQQHPVDISVLVLPEGQDPADFAKANGPEAGEKFLALAERAVPLVAYMIERSLIGRDLSRVEERARAIQGGLSIVADLQDPVRRQEYARVLADRVDVNVGAVLLELDRVIAAREGGAEPETGGRGPGRIPASQKVEREALKLLIQTPRLSASRVEGLPGERFATAGYRKAFELVRELDPAGDHFAASALVARARDLSEQLERLIASLAVEPLETVGDPSPEYAERVFLRLEEFDLKRRADAIRKRLERMNPLDASEEYDVLYEEFVSLEGARRRVRAAAESVGSSV